VYPQGATPRTTSYFYDKVGRNICTVSPDGNWNATRHYPEKEPLKTPDDMDQAIYDQVWGSPWPQGVDGWQGRARVSYRSDGRIKVSKEDLGGRRVEAYSLVIDSDGYLHKSGSRTEYNNKGQAWRRYRVTGVDGADTEVLLSSNTYDIDGRLESTFSEIDGINTAEYGYDSIGRNIWVKNANGIYSTTAYDGDGRIVRTHSGVVSWTPGETSPYCNGGLSGGALETFLEGIRTGASKDQTYVRYVFDTEGKIKQQIVPNDDEEETTTFYMYDSEGRPTHIVHNYFDYNTNGYVLAEDGTEQDIAYKTEYDKYGQRSAIIDAASHQTWFQYDDFGRLYRKILDNDDDLDPTGPDGDDPYEEYTYDNARGLLLSKRNYDGGVIYYEYDDLTDRKTKETYPDGLEIVYKYDSQGRLTSVDETKDGNTRRTAINYDPVTGQPSRIAKPEGTLNYSYNELGSLSRVHESAGSGVDYRYYYTIGGRLDTVITPSGQTKYTYEDWGSRKSQLLPNGVLTEYDYDNLLRTDKITHWKGGTKLAEFNYTVGQTGRCMGVVEEINEPAVPDTIVYEYDGLGRLTESTRTGPSSRVTSYTYDVVGNRQTKVVDGSTTDYDYNALDQLESEDPEGSSLINYYYDDNGNLKTKDDGQNPTNYVYDARNRLAQVHNGEVSPANLWLGYAYDFAGNRVAKGQYTGGVATDTAGFLIDDNNLTGYSQTFYEYDGDTGEVERLYEYGDDLTAELDLASDPEDLHYFLYDGLGTTRALTNAVGTIQQAFNYTPFGEAEGFDPGASFTDHLFTGESYDSDMGQYYLRARMYDPEIGRFTSFDPVEDYGNKLHKYVYCTQDPINCMDPNGTDAYAISLSGAMGINFTLTSISIPMIFVGASKVLAGAGVGIASLALSLLVIQIVAQITQNYSGDNYQYDSLARKRTMPNPDQIKEAIVDIIPYFEPLPLPQRPKLPKNGDGDPVFIVYEWDYETIHAFRVVVLKDFPQFVLNYKGKDEELDNRAAVARHNDVRTDQGHGLPPWEMDEYPYASTLQGGEDAAAAMINETENQREGGDLSAFITYDLGGEAGARFWVMPVPFSTDIPIDYKRAQW
jgi:RHS repeat-associated protein